MFNALPVVRLLPGEIVTTLPVVARVPPTKPGPVLPLRVDVPRSMLRALPVEMELPAETFTTVPVVMLLESKLMAVPVLIADVTLTACTTPAVTVSDGP